tara:strand:+ start:779 stop:1156 length:378 start_codon:yes stop_codon:yes gene_type:complete
MIKIKEMMNNKVYLILILFTVLVNIYCRESLRDSVLRMNHAVRIIGNKLRTVIDLYIVESGLQFYSNNFMGSKNLLKSRSKDYFRTAFCLEALHFLDGINQPNSPYIILNSGEMNSTVSEYKFSI